LSWNKENIAKDGRDRDTTPQVSFTIPANGNYQHCNEYGNISVLMLIIRLIIIKPIASYYCAS